MVVLIVIVAMIAWIALSVLVLNRTSLGPEAKQYALWVSLLVFAGLAFVLSI